MLKRIFTALITALMFFCSQVSAYCLYEAELSAEGAVLYCPVYGEILFEKNSDRQLSMASTTKIMTSLIALEENTPQREILITPEMVNVEGTSSGLVAGERVTLIDLVKCMLLESGNDAANAVAIALGSSFEGFAAIMNNRARQIGMKNTSFVTPSGLDDENHYTTAYDMALLTAEALKDNTFELIASSLSDRVSLLENGTEITLYNHNKLLKTYDGCIGVKTGFTKKSGRCLVSAARRDGIVLIAVTLNAGDDWNDHKKMLDYGFSLFSKTEADTDFSMYSVRVTGAERESVIPVSDGFSIGVLNQSEMTRRVCLDKFLYAPVSKGDIIGSAQYYCGEKLIKEIPLFASEDVCVKQGTENKNIFDRLLSLFDSWWKNGR